jgi:hypothetical protein
MQVFSRRRSIEVVQRGVASIERAVNITVYTISAICGETQRNESNDRGTRWFGQEGDAN